MDECITLHVNYVDEKQNWLSMFAGLLCIYVYLFCETRTERSVEVYVGINLDPVSYSSPPPHTDVTDVTVAIIYCDI